jgi:hypothetical protein
MDNMDSLKIASTQITPEINFDVEKKIFVISGESRPENVKDFFEPILLWIDNYFSEANKQTKHLFQIKLEYFNSSSAKYLLTILKKVGLFYQNGTEIIVQWYYETDDDDMKEAGEQMSEMSKMPFEIIEVDKL